MKNKWVLLALMFVLGFLTAPVYASPLGDGVFVGAFTETPSATATIQPGIEHLETGMETVFFALLTVIITFGFKRTSTADTVPERYDKALSATSLNADTRMNTKRTKSELLKRQAS